MGGTGELEGAWLVEPGGAIGARTTMSDRAIVKEVTVGLDRRQVWGLWTSSEGLAKWLIPQSRIELRLGGRYEFLFDPSQPPGLQGGEGCKVCSFLPPRLLCFTWNAPPHLDYTRARMTHVVLELDEVEGGTRVRLTHVGWPSEEEDPHPQWGETFAYFDSAWGSVMSALLRHAGAPGQPG